MPHTEFEALRLTIARGDRSGLCLSYLQDLAYYRQRGDLLLAYYVLHNLAYEYRRQGKKRKAQYFYKQAANTVETIVESDRAIARAPQFEGFDRIMLRVRLAELSRHINGSKSWK